MSAVGPSTDIEADRSTPGKGAFRPPPSNERCRSIVSGWKNKVQSSLAHITPAGMLARQHRKMAEPGTAGSKTEPLEEEDG